MSSPCFAGRGDLVLSEIGGLVGLAASRVSSDSLLFLGQYDYLKHIIWVDFLRNRGNFHKIFEKK
jgi:hypothetical protein